jgi:hypothetical protein
MSRLHSVFCGYTVRRVHDRLRNIRNDYRIVSHLARSLYNTGLPVCDSCTGRRGYGRIPYTVQ